MALAVSSRVRRSQIAARQRPAWRLSPVLVAAGLGACGLHVVLWWGWAHQGLTGARAGVASAVPAAFHVRLGVPSTGLAALPPTHADTDAPVDGVAMTADAPVRTQLAEAPPSQGTDVVPSESMHQPAGPQWLAGRYTPADQLDQSPRPELGWFLDEDVLAPLPHGSMLVQLWVSVEGRIDRAELLRADPPGDWALRALVPLPGTPMRPGVRDGHPVAATLVVELVSDNERFR